MNNKLLLGLVVIVVIGAVFFVTNSQNSSTGLPDSTNNQVTPGDYIARLTSTPGAETTQNQTRYLTYSSDTYAQNQGNRRVLFFHATWCPTCKATNEEFMSMSSKIPSDVVVLKTDYDSFPELKKQYGVTYQHTFVQVDQNGNALSTWNGGGIDELLANLK